MKNILTRIIEDKKKEVQERIAEFPISQLEESRFFKRAVVSLKESLLSPGSSGIIAEFKRMSPSVGHINRYADPAEITRGYVHAGASALSVLTDRKYFGGSRDDMMRAREVNHCPILRKDFMIDEYQVIEAKALGADVILLIASVLDNSILVELAKLARSFEMEVILEIHDPTELSSLNPWIDGVGVNNRNLRMMETDVQTSIDMVEKIPDDFLKISESGINDPETINFLKGLGYRGFLIGEHFMKQEKPASACRKFIEKMQVPNAQ